jgi:arylsulfatase A-like enzyme
MNRRWAVAATTALLTGFLGSCGGNSKTAPPAVAPAGAPNVVVLMSDDQDYASMRVMPNVERLIGARGVTFSRFYVSYPLCCPSRTTFLTGQYAHNTGVQGNFPDQDGGGYLNLREPDRTLPVWLQAAGYRTAHVGKWAELPPGIPPGWNRWWALTQDTISHYYDYSLNRPGGGTIDFGASPRDYNTTVLTRFATRFIGRQAAGEQPFFLSVAYNAPHFGYGRNDVASRRCGSVPQADVIPRTAVPAPRDAGAFAHAPLPRPPSFDEADVSDKPPFDRRHRLSSADVRSTATDYRCRLASLLGVDRSVARIVASLRSAGELRNTLILYTSDNGFLLGQHREPYGKNLPYEEAIRVPLLARGPGLPAGETVADPTVNADLAPTILDAAGVRPPAASSRPLDGRSLLPRAGGDESWPQRGVLIEGRDDAADADGGRFQSLSYQGVRTGRYLYVRWHRALTATYTEATAATIGAGPVVASELYDTSSDPFELQNRAGNLAYAAPRKALAAELSRLVACEGKSCRTESAIPPPAS